MNENETNKDWNIIFSCQPSISHKTGIFTHIQFYLIKFYLLLLVYIANYEREKNNNSSKLIITMLTLNMRDFLIEFPKLYIDYLVYFWKLEN